MLQDNIVKFFEESFRENSDKPAITDYFTSEVFTYYTMSSEIAKLHMLFKQSGLKNDDKVVLVGRNNPRWVMTAIAVMTYGAVVMPIMQDSDSNDINHIINQSGARLVFLSDPFWDVIETSRSPKLKAVFSLSDFRCIYERDGDKLKNFQRNILKHYNSKYKKGFLKHNIAYEAPKLDKLAVVCYTAGSTGFSKGVKLTIGNLTSSVRYLIDRKVYYQGCRTLSMLPLGHIYGFAIDMIAPLVCGAHITLLGRTPSMKVLVKALQGVHPHVVWMVPRVMEKIIRKELMPSLQSGAAKIAAKIPGVNTMIDPAFRKKLVNIFGGEIEKVFTIGASFNAEIEQLLVQMKFPYSVCYGLTECGALVSCSLPENFTQGSSGRIVDRTEVRIASDDPAKIPGEILVRGENVMSGYYKDKKATAAVMDKDEWLHTGDIGILKPDDTLFIRGRMATRIERGEGVVIYPEEIESKLDMMTCVMESLVAKRNGKLVAFVVPDYEQTDTLCIGVSGIREVMKENMNNLNATLSEHQQLSDIILFPAEFEKTPKMSIRRYVYVK